MSIAGYFVRRGPERRMRRELRDELGIQFDGVVLTGKKSLEERRAEDAATAGRKDGEFYSGLEDYDPVLNSHCRL